MGGAHGWIVRSWKTSKRSNFGLITPGGRSSKEIARKVSQWKTQMIVEVPPEAAVHQTKQYKMLTEDELWVSIKINGCMHGQRLVMPLREGDQNLAYCKVGWEYLAANIKIWPKLSDKCRSDHTHASQECMHEPVKIGTRQSDCRSSGLVCWSGSWSCKPQSL